jgi:cell division protein ZapD
VSGASGASCADLQRWMTSLMPLQAGISMVMRLLRETGQATDAIAPQGAYQQMLAGKTYQLLRVWVDESAGVFPEISANKYMLWTRFMTCDGETKPRAFAEDVAFELSLCNF